MTNQEWVSDVQSCRLSPGLACARRERRSQSIPAELAAPSTSAYCERPPGCTLGQETGPANKVTPNRSVVTLRATSEAWNGADLCRLCSCAETATTGRHVVPVTHRTTVDVKKLKIATHVFILFSTTRERS